MNAHTALKIIRAIVNCFHSERLVDTPGEIRSLQILSEIRNILIKAGINEN